MTKLGHYQIFFTIAFSIVTAIPFTIAWNGIAQRYLYFIPTVYQKIPYWDMVGIVIVIAVIGECVGKLTPRIFSIKQETKNKD